MPNGIISDRHLSTLRHDLHNGKLLQNAYYMGDVQYSSLGAW